jgi:hypothetical protein
MFWDFTTTLWAIVGLILLTVVIWLKYRSDSSDERKSDIRRFSIYSALVLCVGFSVVASYVSPRVEINGQIIKSYVSSRRLDLSYFQVRSATGEEVRLRTVVEIARALNTTQTVHVVYEKWESKPVAIDVISGDRPGVLLSLADGNHLSALGIIIFLVLVVLFIRSIVRLRTESVTR